MPKRLATNADLLAIAPDYSAIDVAVRNAYLDLTGTMIGVNFWGNQASYAHALLAAHFLYMAPDGGPGGGGGAPAGPLASEANGPASRGYATVSPGGGSDDDLALSPYGIMLITLRKRVRARSGVTSMRRGFKAGIIR